MYTNIDDIKKKLNWSSKNSRLVLLNVLQSTNIHNSLIIYNIHNKNINVNLNNYLINQLYKNFIMLNI